MGTAGLIAVLVAVSTPTATISRPSVEHQNKVFEEMWGTPLVWKFDDLPTESAVPSFRLPYSGYIYPDRQGGTASALTKYDRAFNRGRMLATGHERWDTTAFKKPEKKRGLFGLGRTVMQTPDWHGHCNGWAAATMRHAEPQETVRFNGVTFTPADIKALLAEIYIYNDLEHLAGLKHAMNAGTFHAIITNWVGRGRHPIGMEADPTEEKWNYPVYAYASSFAKRSPTVVEVKMNLAYIKDTNGEYQEGPHIQRYKYFHYQLHLDHLGNIRGGSFYRDSSRIDMLWFPRRPKPSRTAGNESGNPYVNVDQVLAVWRASVPAEERKRWLVIDPSEQDRVLEVEDDIEGLVPIQFRQPIPNASSVADTEAAPNAETTATDATPNDEPESTEMAASEPSAESQEAPEPETHEEDRPFVASIGDETETDVSITQGPVEEPAVPGAEPAMSDDEEADADATLPPAHPPAPAEESSTDDSPPQVNDPSVPVSDDEETPAEESTGAEASSESGDSTEEPVEESGLNPPANSPSAPTPITPPEI